MKRDELKAKGLTDEQIEYVMAENGKDVEAGKQKLAALQTELEGVQGQLSEAGKTIEGFKKLDVDAIRAAADDWKAKAEQAQKDGEARVSQLRFDHALDSAITGAKAKNSKAVRALIDTGALKLNEADGSIIGLKEQLEKVQSENDYLFDSDNPAPEIVLGGNNQQVKNVSAFEAAARRGAGLPVQGQGK